MMVVSDLNSMTRIGRYEPPKFTLARFFGSHGVMGYESLKLREGKLWRLISTNPGLRIQI